MDNGQFQIPQQELPVTPEIIQEIESSFAPADVTEMNVKPPYEQVKQYERDITEHREQYMEDHTEADLPKRYAVDIARWVVKFVVERL